MEERSIEHPQTPNDEQKKVFRVGVSPSESNMKIGQARSHLYTYAFARSESEKGHDSTVIFRMDNSNRERHTRERAEAIYRFFSETLGLHFDVTPENAQETLGQSVYQSERQDIYQERLKELFDKKVAFVDPESGLALFDIEAFINQYADVLEIDDLLRGRIKLQLENLLQRGQKYFPLMRSDQSALYHLASVVDDGSFGVTHVVRGENKLSIAEYQEMVRTSLGLQPVKYLHTPMLLDTDGSVLKKGEVKFDDFIKRGVMPHTLISYMISSGYGKPDEIYASVDQFVAGFDYRNVHRTSGKFDPERLRHINEQMVKMVTPEVFVDSLVLYCAKNNEMEVAERIRQDQPLQELLLSYRRTPSETATFVKRILTPTYDSVDEAHRHGIETTLRALGNAPGRIQGARETGLSQQELFDSLRWILVGTTPFSGIAKIANYLERQGMLEERVRMARTHFSS